MPHPLAEAFGKMIRAELEVQRVQALFGAFSKEQMRQFWDGVGDDSFYTGPEGEFDCADIHFFMNLTGDGAYCAV